MSLKAVHLMLGVMLCLPPVSNPHTPAKGEDPGHSSYERGVGTAAQK